MTAKKLFRYPVKGLSGEPQKTLRLVGGQGIAFDRVFAIARQVGTFDRNNPTPVSKDKFIMLMRDEALARLETHFDDNQFEFTISENGQQQLKVSLNEPDGQRQLAAFLKAYTKDDDIEPEFACASDHKFTDISVVSKEKMNAISLINLASVDALSEAIGEKIDPMRFRANVYFEGSAPWSEFDWLDRDISIGSAGARVTMKTRRCAATQVNPKTALRDINIPAEIRKNFGHLNMGVYAEILADGTVSPGDPVGIG